MELDGHNNRLSSSQQQVVSLLTIIREDIDNGLAYLRAGVDCDLYQLLSRTMRSTSLYRLPRAPESCLTEC